MKRDNVASWLVLAAIFLTWECSVRWLQISSLLLPSPIQVLRSLVENLLNGVLVKHGAVTLIEILGGFVLGSSLGICLGGVIALSPKIHRILNPYIIASQTMPKLALAPLFALWFGFGYTPKILIAGLICFFPLFESTVTGLTVIPREQSMLFRSLGASKWQTLIKLQIPHALPYLFSGFRIAVVLSVVGAIVGEFIGANAGLGTMIMVAQSTMDTPLMFAVFIVLTVIGLLLYKLFIYLERLLKIKHYK